LQREFGAECSNTDWLPRLLAMQHPLPQLLTPRWLIKHLVALAAIGSCLALGWWQISRAIGGNALSWAYTVEWPVFAGFVALIWWREITYTLHPPEPPEPNTQSELDTPAAEIAVDLEEPDKEVAGYNQMLAWLAKNPGRRIADYRADREELPL
jgi:hypothetical protein